MRWNLRRRIAVALFALATLTAGVLAGALWIGHLRLENALLEDVLDRQLDIYLATGATPQTAGSVSNDLRLYRQRDVTLGLVPPAIAALPPGSHRDVRVAGGVYHVRVRDVVANDRAWLLYDMREFERRESQLLLALAASVAFTGLFAWGLSGSISRRLLSPLNTLAQRLRGLDWNERAPRLPAFDDEDLQTITAALNRLLSEVDSLVQRERAFASAASHELRTPLASIRAAAEVLATGAAAPAPVARIGRAVISASQQLDALLALSRQRALPPAENLRLDLVLPPMAEPHLTPGTVGIEWQLRPLTLATSKPVLEIVFTNLLRNALRAARTQVRVRLDTDRLLIEDDGAGIAADLRATIFEPGVKSADGGSGMGLYIARSLAERMGWKIELQPRTAAEGTAAILVFG